MPSEIEKISFGKKLKELNLITYSKSLKNYEKKISEAIKLKNEIPIFIDTNVLLRYYTTSFSKRKGLLNFFLKHKKEIILTNQVQKEFVKNREDIIERFFSDTLKGIEGSYTDSIVNPTQKYIDDNKKFFDDLSLFSEKIEKINTEIKKLSNTLDKEIKALKENFESTKNEDQLLELIQEMELVNQLKEEDVKFLKSEFDELKKNIDPKQVQNESKKPQAAFPGLGDIKKKPLNPYGDYLLFHEMLLYIKNNKKDALFITYDSTKSDWLKENKEPHSHYIQIVYLSTSQNLFIVDADRFFDEHLKEHFNSLISKIDYYAPKSDYEKEYILEFVALERAIKSIARNIGIEDDGRKSLLMLIDVLSKRGYMEISLVNEFRELNHFKNMLIHASDRSIIDSLPEDHFYVLLTRLREMIKVIDDLHGP